MRPERRKPRSAFRRAERWAIGLVFAVFAFVLERVVMRSVRKGGTKAAAPQPTTISTKGTNAAIRDPGGGKT